MARSRATLAAQRLTPVGICQHCGRIYPEEAGRCGVCDAAPVPMLQHAGRLSTCPVCGDTYTRGDIVTPLRTGTASTVSVLATHHLDGLRGEDRNLLVFADNRQDAAHQAGYTAHKHRTFAFRHIIVDELRKVGPDGLALTELPQRIVDRYRETGIARRQIPRQELARWLQAITYELASEVTRYSQERAALETLGLVVVAYEFLDGLRADGRSEAESSGRLEPFHFCRACDEAVESGANRCPRCGDDLEAATDVIFADAFEAEESTSITADEEARQRRAFVVKEALLPTGSAGGRLYPYDGSPLTLLSGADVLLTNWGGQGRTGEAGGFWLCPECGRHQPHPTTDPEHQAEVQRWQASHRRLCPQGEPQPLILGYRFRTDVLVLPVVYDHTAADRGAGARTPLTVTLAQALILGASQVLQVEANELRAFVRRGTQGERSREVVFYETVPGGAGYLEELARRLS